MVQLLPKGTMAYPNPGSPELRSSEGGGVKKERRAASGGAGDHPGPSVLNEKEKRRLAMERNHTYVFIISFTTFFPNKIFSWF